MFTVTVHNSQLHQQFVHDSTSLRIGTSHPFGAEWNIEDLDLQIESLETDASDVVISNQGDSVELPWQFDQIARDARIKTQLPLSLIHI